MRRRTGLARLLFGARISLAIGVIAALISGVIGTSLGILAGYFGGKVDLVISFIITARLAMPVILVALAVVATAGSSLVVFISVLGLLIWDRYALVMRATTQQIADAGGFVGVTMFPAFPRRDAASTIEDYLDAIEHVINLIGEEAVGVGTDMTQEQPPSFFDWINRDKGRRRKLVDFGKALELDGFRRLRDFPNLTAGMERRRWPESRITRVLGGNWLILLGEVWHV